MDLTAYYAAVKQHRAALAEQNPKGFCHLCSLNNLEKGTVAGNVTVVANDNAARCLAEATHRLATEDEVKGWEALQESNRVQSEEAEMRARTQYFVDRDRAMNGGGKGKR